MGGHFDYEGKIKEINNLNKEVNSEDFWKMVFLSYVISLEHCVFFADFTYDSVCGKDNDKSDDGLIEAGCCRHSDISGFHQAAVYVGINNIGCRVQKS